MKDSLFFFTFLSDGFLSLKKLLKIYIIYSCDYKFFTLDYISLNGKTHGFSTNMEIFPAS